VGACETCKGFGRTMEIDPDLVVPDPRKSLAEGAIKPFQTPFYAECQKDLLRFLRREGLPADAPWKELPDQTRRLVWEGEPGGREDCKRRWYGIAGFFDWLESRTYRMRVRVFLSRYRLLALPGLFSLVDQVLHRNLRRHLGLGVVVVEHHMELAKSADWVIDLGPEAGDDGGRVVGEGPAEAVAALDTPTGRALREALAGPPARLRAPAASRPPASRARTCSSSRGRSCRGATPTAPHLHRERPLPRCGDRRRAHPGAPGRRGLSEGPDEGHLPSPPGRGFELTHNDMSCRCCA
jgi:hypothetical protein